MPTPYRKASALTIALALAAAGGTARAETSPWYLGASQTFGYDSNVFRLPDQVTITNPDGSQTVFEAQSSGLISVTRLLGGFDITPSRQHLYANVSLDARRYGDQPQLDSNGYGLTAGWDWETLERLSGTIRLQADRRPGNYADWQVPTINGRYVEEPVRASFIARLGDRQSRMWLEAGYYYTRIHDIVDFGALRDFLGATQVEGYDRTIPSNAVSFGVKYRFAGETVVGLGLRYEEGDEDYTLRQTSGGSTATRLYNSYDRQDIDLTGRWDASAISKLNARISYTTTDNTGTLSRADYSGPTAALWWEWLPTGKLRSVARMNYDTQIREETIGTTTNPAWSLGWDLTWAASAKVSVNGGLRWSQRDWDGIDAKDTRRGANIGITWAPLRNVSLDCSLGRESRNDAGALRDYSTNLTYCTVQAMLR
jgi:hypothetical protein